MINDSIIEINNVESKKAPLFYTILSLEDGTLVLKRNIGFNLISENKI